MPVTIKTEQTRPIRLVTGWYTFDKSFENKYGDVGYPLGKSAEIYGPTHCGKSTFVYALSGVIASKLACNINLADLEGFDPEFAVQVMTNSGMTEGEIYHIVRKTHEETMQELLDTLWEEGDQIGILDSIGAVSPVAEKDGDLGDANMGQRAKLMNAFCRRLTNILNQFPNQKNVFMTNHVHSNLLGPGIITPGGTGKEFLNSVRIMVKRKEEFEDGSYILEGLVKKNRWGFHGRRFYLHVLPGIGVHTGLTALFDCFMLKLADRKKVISMNGEKYGYYSTIRARAFENDQEYFQPFIQRIQENSANNLEPEDDNDSASEDD